ncbi:MAG: hypothetical protein M0Z76_09855 [Gammaproteobacteria bacterium]|nr:hypothetical protein [Gammaproteobacteria bacterium]
MRLTRWVLWPLCACLVGCEVGQVPVPPPVPGGLLSGMVIGGEALAGAPVTVLDGGRIIATTRTDDSGHFTVAVQVPSAVLTVRTEGVAYVRATDGEEEVSGPLDAQILYEQGVSETLAVSPWSTAAAALAGYLQGTGIAAPSALRDADAAFAAWLGYPPLLLPQPVGAGAQTVSAANEAALTLAGLSAWAHAQGQTTAAVTALMAADVADDGFLNGAAASGPLHLGALPLSADAYRSGLAEGVLQAAVAGGLMGTAQTPLAQAITAYAKALANSASPLFGGDPPAAFASSPVAVSLAPLPAWTRGPLTIEGSVDDPLQLPVAVTLTVDGQAGQSVTTQGAFAFRVATPDFADGVHELAVHAVDGAGEQGQAQATVGFDNGGPQACVVSFIGQPTLGTLRGRWSDPAGISGAWFVGGAVNVLPNGTWSVFTGPEFLAPMTLTLADAAGNVRTFVWNLRLGQGGCG